MSCLSVYLSACVHARGRTMSCLSVCLSVCLCAWARTHHVCLSVCLLVCMGEDAPCLEPLGHPLPPVAVSSSHAVRRQEEGQEAQGLWHRGFTARMCGKVKCLPWTAKHFSLPTLSEDLSRTRNTARARQNDKNERPVGPQHPLNAQVQTRPRFLHFLRVLFRQERM
jgi:hypothetical protein